MNSAAIATLKVRWNRTTVRPGLGSIPASNSVISLRKGSASTQPVSRLIRLPSGRRIAAGSPERALISGFRALPRLAPSTMASAATGATSPAWASVTMTSTAAMLECMAQVTSVARARTTSGSLVSASTMLRASGATAPGAKVSTSMWSASRARPRPNKARPMLRGRVREVKRNVISPASSSTGNSSVTSKASAQVTRAVPMLAPSIVASAGTGPITPAAPNELVIKAVAVLLCRTSVTPRPASSAVRRWRNALPSTWRRSPPKARMTPVEIMCTPQSRSAISPNISMMARVTGKSSMRHAKHS